MILYSKEGARMDFKIGEDMKMVRELLNITQEELAIQLDVEPLTILDEH